MIKLIASDLDGTLLDPAGNLPAGTFDAVEELYEHGVLFCAASGRQLAALQQMFAPVADKILIMAENGALVAHGQNILYTRPLHRMQVSRALDAVRTLYGAHALVCTANCAYYRDEAQPFLQCVQAAYLRNVKSDLKAVAAREEVCKVAVYDDLGPENSSMKVLPRALPDLRVIQSGANWLDISDKDAHKGRAMQFILELCDLRPVDCAAFGDHMNDYEMLLAVGHPYVTANAFPPLKRLIGTVIGSNHDGGVLQALHAIAQGKQP